MHVQSWLWFLGLHFCFWSTFGLIMKLLSAGKRKKAEFLKEINKLSTIRLVTRATGKLDVRQNENLLCFLCERLLADTSKTRDDVTFSPRSHTSLQQCPLLRRPMSAYILKNIGESEGTASIKHPVSGLHNFWPSVTDIRADHCKDNKIPLRKHLFSVKAV